MASNGAAEYFLKIDGIAGESTKKGFTDQIEIESFSWGVSQDSSHGTGTGGGTGKASVSSIQFTTKANKASPKLMIAVMTGQHFKGKSATFTLRKSGGKQEAYMTWKLSDITISSYQTGGSSGGDSVPTDSFAISFTKIEVEYKPQKEDGSLGAAVTAGYDLSAMDKV